MKKVIVIIMIITISFTMTGCIAVEKIKEKYVEYYEEKYNRNPWTYYNTEVAKNRIEEILKYIKSNSNEDIKSLFAKKVVKKDKNIDKEIIEFLDCFKGGIIKHYFSEKVNKKEKKEEVDFNTWRVTFKYSFLVFTKDSIYELSIKDVQQDDNYLNNIGLQYIHVKKVKNYKNDDNYEVYDKTDIKGKGIIIQ
ncbi:MAG: DUF5104 domain-containing protein [Eubacterium sp.]|nr:DUF5104 domain-containing protein [Eubacterium sp.]